MSRSKESSNWKKILDLIWDLHLKEQISQKPTELNQEALSYDEIGNDKEKDDEGLKRE